MASPNVTEHRSDLNDAERFSHLGQRGTIIWLTGLSGSGKSTIAMALEARLITSGRFAFALDGDNLRHGLCGDLDFTPDGRSENIRRAGEVAKLFQRSGALVLCSFISPYRSHRDALRSSLPKNAFLEVYVDAPLSACEARDPKGLYAKARAGEITDFTGISAPYEAPEKPDIHLDTASLSVDECVERIYQRLVLCAAISDP